MSDPTAPGNPLDQIIANYLQAAEAGKVPSRQALLDAHPDYADDLRAFFADYDRLDNRADALRLAQTRPPAQRPKVRYLGDFELLEEIAEGGMGLVYKARQESLGRIVALKLVRAGRVAKPIDIARFRIEAEAAAGLDHPNIVPLYEVGEHQGQHYLAMKFIDGPSLAKLPRGSIKTEVTRLEAIARAVDFAHRQGILHRDIKPSNILTDAAGTPYVTDFGLAKRIDAELSLTESGQMLGTAGYIAPEQALGKKGLTVTADVFSLGAVLFERLTGTPAFPGGTILERLRSLHDAEPRLPRSFQRRGYRDLETICLKCLEKEPGKRYPSAGALADDLDLWLRGEPIRARPTRVSERVIRWTRRHRTPVTAIGAATGTALVAAVLVMTFVQHRPAIMQVPPVHDGAIMSAPDWLVRTDTRDGQLTSSCWRTSEPDMLATSMVALGMSSADAPHPTRLEAVWMAGRPEERVFPVTIAKLDEATQTATLRVRATTIPESKAQPVNLERSTLDVSTLARIKESVVFISAKHGEECNYGSGFLAQPGLILTCTDVLGMADPMIPPPEKIEISTGVGTPDQRVFLGNLVAVDRNERIALIRVAGESLPQPLPIAATANMRESEKTFFLGYPIGQGWKATSLQTTFKIRPSAFNGRIFTRQGSVKYLSFEGGADPGSGMAVVNSSGEVIGVDLAGARNANIRFVEPSEYITGLLEGRVLELTPGQAVQSAKSIRQPMKLLVADPLERIAEISLECWTSPRPKAVEPAGGPARSILRPGMERQPIPRAGDGPVVTARMNYDSEANATNREGQIATGELILAPLSVNDIYWVRPRYGFKNGRERWGEAVVVEMGRYPVELKSARLTVRNSVNADTTRLIELDRRSFESLYVVGEDSNSGRRFQDLDLSARLTQEFKTVKSNGEGDSRLRYQDLRASGSDFSRRFGRRADASVGESAKGIAVNVVVTKEGKIGSVNADLSGIPAGQRAVLDDFNSKIIGGLQALSWAMPNKIVLPGTTWTDEVGLRMDLPDVKRDALLTTTCKYVGRRLRNGRSEALISMTGSKPPTKEAAYGTIAGDAAVDLESGQMTLGIIEANLASNARVAVNSEESKVTVDAFAAAKLRQSLRELVVPEDANADLRSVLPNQRIILAPLVGVGAPSALAD